MGWRRSFEPIERLGHRTFLVRACERFRIFGTRAVVAARSLRVM